MSQISMGSKFCIIAIMVMFMAACGTPNSESSFDSDSGHPANWLPAGHKTAALADMNVCQECHGQDYSGGVSGVSCSSCHLGGASSVHPLAWISAYASHQDYVLLQGNATSCSNINCHGANYQGVAGSGDSCTSCHSRPYYSCTACHEYPPANGRHVSHVTGHGAQNATCAACHALSASTHYNLAVDIASSITYSFTTKSCAPVCHGPQTW